MIDADNACFVHFIARRGCAHGSVLSSTFQTIGVNRGLVSAYQRVSPDEELDNSV